MEKQVGDSQSVRYEARDADGTLTNATVVLTVRDPDDVLTTPTVSHPSTGIYTSTFDLDESGLWRWRWDVTGTIVDKGYGEVDVVPAANTLYVSLAVLKQACGEIADTDRDTLLLQAAGGASRGIDRECGYPRRRFWRDWTASARIFRSAERQWYDRDDGSWCLGVDDIADGSDIVVESSADRTTWTTVDATTYYTSPDNAEQTREAVTDLRYYARSWSARWYRVTAPWGWPAVPDDVALAAQLQASRLYARRNSPEGVAGNSEWGIARVSRLDPDVRRLIKDFRLPGLA